MLPHYTTPVENDGTNIYTQLFCGLLVRWLRHRSCESEVVGLTSGRSTVIVHSHTLRWDGMGWDNSVYFNGGVHTLS